MVKEYYSENALSVKFYDATASIDPSIKGDVAFYLQYLQSSAQQVLEIGCGTGRVAIALAARGHFVIGIDKSEPMLRRARMKCRKLPLTELSNVQFLQHDMVTFDLGMQFQLIIVPYYTFNHLKGRSLRARSLATMARHLLPGGRAIIHVASPEKLQESRTTQKHVFHFTESSVRLRVTWNQRVLDQNQRRFSQIIGYELLATDGTLVAASAERLTLWWFSDPELIKSAQKAGLEHEQTLTSFGPEAGRERIYVLKKRPSQSREAGESA
jgi:SAM-dependent methyltransferase